MSRTAVGVSLFPVTVPCVLRDFEVTADFSGGVAGGEHVEDFSFVVAEDLLFGAAAGWTSEHDTFGLAQGKCFLCAEGDEVALDLCNESEGETENLAVDGVVKAIPFLDSIDVDAFLETAAHDGHDVRKVSAEARDLRDDNGVTFLHS